MNPAAKRFQKTYGPIADAVSSADIGQTNREAVALALADALDGRPDFRRDTFLAIASDPLVACMGVQGIPCKHDRRMRVPMHNRHAPDGRAMSWQESLPIVRCVSCGFDQRVADARAELLDLTAEEMEADILAMTAQQVFDELARQRSEANRRESIS